jgi:hypothetical protein
MIGSPVVNHQPQQWLKDIYNTSDIVCFDIYGQDPTHPESADTFLNEVRFFVKNYAENKPICVTENGYSSGLEDPSVARQPGHAQGTEAQQAAYFRNVFEALAKKGQPGFEYLRNLLGYCIWCYIDQKDGAGPVQKHFGLSRVDGTHKPAWDAVNKGIARIESDPILTPWKQAGSRDIRQSLNGPDGVPLHYENGTRHDVLEIELAKSSSPSTLKLTFDHPVSVVAQLPDGTWQADIVGDKIDHNIEVPAVTGSQSKVKLRATASKLPVNARLLKIALTPSLAASQNH